MLRPLHETELNWCFPKKETVSFLFWCCNVMFLRSWIKCSLFKTEGLYYFWDNYNISGSYPLTSFSIFWIPYYYFRPVKHVKHCFQFFLQQHHERKYISQNIGGQGFSLDHYWKSRKLCIKILFCTVSLFSENNIKVLLVNKLKIRNPIFLWFIKLKYPLWLLNIILSSLLLFET